MQRDYMPRTKQAIYQEKGVFSFSMDSVLLSAFSEAKGRTLDLGCGSGYIAMNAYETAAEVVAVDIEARAIALLRKSIKENEMDIQLICEDISQLETPPFDTIITNPPFYRDSLKNNTLAIAGAKHMPKEMSWFTHAGRLLKEKGTLYGICEISRFQDVVDELTAAHLSISHMRPVYWRRGEEARRILFSAKLGGRFLHIDAPLVIYDGDVYSEEVASYYGG